MHYGAKWGKQSYANELLEKARAENKEFLAKKLRNGKHAELFREMGKEYTKAMPNPLIYELKVVLPRAFN